MQLSTDVLPAPLGPMSARSSPRFTSRDTPSRMRRPPSDSDTSLRDSDTSLSASSTIPAAAAAILLHVPVAAAFARAAKIELLDVAVGAQPLGCSIEHDAAVLHYIAVVRYVEREPCILLDQQHRDAGLGTHRLQALHQLLDQERREALRELVDKEEPRGARERRSYGQHLPLAAGEVPCFAAAQARERRKKFVGHAGKPAPVRARTGDGGLEVLRHGEILEHLALLRNQRNPERGHAVRRKIFDALAGEPDRAFGHARIVKADESRDRA